LREEIAAEVNEAVNTAQSDPTPRASEDDWRAMARRIWWTNSREHHLPRSDPRSAGAGSCAKTIAFTSTAGHRR
jgi:hypothetical protein